MSTTPSLSLIKNMLAAFKKWRTNQYSVLHDSYLVSPVNETDKSTNTKNCESYVES